MNETNRLIITLFAAACIVFAAVVIFVAWARPEGAIERLADIVTFLDDNNNDTGKLIVSLGALAFAVLSLLVIIVELAPEDEPSELKVEQAGATTIVPAEALRNRIDEALVALPEVISARSRVWAKDRGIAAALNLTAVPNANLSSLTQEAARVVVDVVQTDLGLPVAGVPRVKVNFGGSKVQPPPTADTAPMRDEPPLERTETVDERISGTPEQPQPDPAPRAWSEPERRPMGVVEAENPTPGPASEEPREDPRQA